MTRICFVNTNKAWGGGERWHFDMAVRLKRRDFDIRVLAYKDGDLYSRIQEEQMNLQGLRPGNLSFLNPLVLIRLYRFFKKTDPDVVILNLPGDLKMAAPMAKLAKIKKIIYRRGSAIPIRNSLLNRVLFKNCITGIIANSEMTKKTILENNPMLFPADRIKVIYNGIDTGIFQQNTEPSGYTGKNDELVIGNLGRMVKQKAQDHLVDIAVRLKKQEIPFRIILGGDGPLRGTLENKIRNAGLQQFFTFTGFVNDVNGFMQMIDIFALPSLWEGFGYVLVEAMACGRPVIAYNHSSNPEIIIHEKTGFLVEPGNTREFSDRIIHFAYHPEKLKIMGRNAHTHAEQNFTLERSVEKLIGVIK